MDQNQKQPLNISEKSFTSTLLLSFFLGWLGIHRFYVGRYISATLMGAIPLIKVCFAVYLVFVGMDLEALTGQPVSDETLKGILSTPVLASYYLIDALFWVVTIVRFYDIVLLAGHRFIDASGAILIPKQQEHTSEHSYFATLMLARYAGMFGLHRFYVGKPISGFFMAITLGGVGIWWLVDQILIMTQNFWDSNENTVCVN